MKRKILSMILGTAIAASLLTGCGGSQEGRQEGRRCHAYTVIRALD